MTWRTRLTGEVGERWTTLEAAAVHGGAPPEGMDEWDLVQAIFRAAEARGLVEMAPDGNGFSVGAEGATVEVPLTALASGDVAGWAVAVRAVVEAPAPPAEPADPTPARWDRDGASRVWALVREMHLRARAGTQVRLVVARDHGGTGGLAWVPVGDDQAIASLDLGNRATEWQRKDGARLAWVPNPALAPGILFAAEKAGLIRVEAGIGGPVPVAAPGQEALVAVLLTHQSAAEPNDDGLHALVDRLVDPPAP